MSATTKLRAVLSLSAMVSAAAIGVPALAPADNGCPNDLVPRLASPYDPVCVTKQVAAEIAQENANAANLRDPKGPTDPTRASQDTSGVRLLTAMLFVSSLSGAKKRGNKTPPPTWDRPGGCHWRPSAPRSPRCPPAPRGRNPLRSSRHRLRRSSRPRHSRFCRHRRAHRMPRRPSRRGRAPRRVPAERRPSRRPLRRPRRRSRRPAIPGSTYASTRSGVGRDVDCAQHRCGGPVGADLDDRAADSTDPQ